MTKKKLLVTASTFPRWEGDSEPRFILDLCKALNAYFDVTVLVPMAPGAKIKENLEGVNIERFHYFPIHQWEALCYPGAIVPRIKQKKVRAFLVPFLILSQWWNLKKRAGQYDLAHAHWIIPQGIVQSFVNIPYMVTGHGSDVLAMNKGLIKNLKLRTLKRAKKISFVSKELEDQLYSCEGFTGQGFEKKTEIQSMGCNTELFSNKNRQENYFSQGDKKVVLFVGRLAPVKGIEYLIEAMKDVDAKLVIVGSGTLEEKLKKLAADSGADIEFLGSKTHQELRLIYPSADLFVMPSITLENGSKEGFGLVALEAMASGLPVIGSRSGGIVNIIDDGLNGFLVPEKDPAALSEKINRILGDPALAHQLSENGQKTADQYSYKAIAKRYAKMLEGALNDAR